MHRLLLILISLFFTGFIFADRGISVIAKTNRIALVIGNSNYQSMPLKNPVNDATDMASILKQKGFAVTLLTDVNKRQMQNAISQFGKQLRNGGVGLFFFAGHGMQVNGTNYLIPIGATIKVEDDIEYESVDANRVLSKMESAANDLNMVFLDACRNNPFAKSFRSFNKGLAQMNAPKGSFVSFATAPGSVAADGNGRNGIFTGQLLKQIQVRGLELTKMMKEVRKGVLRESEDQQIPWDVSSLTGDFYFSGPENATEVASGSAVTESVSLGSIRVETQPPNAKIYVNQLFEGSSPVILKLTPGAYNVVAKKNGYKNQQESVRVRSDRNISLNLIMDRSGGSIFIRSFPENAKIYLNKDFYGNAPDSITALKAGNYNITVKLKGYSDYTKSVYLNEGQEQRIIAVLSKKVAFPNMVLIQAGYFEMGSNEEGIGDNNPIRSVYLDDFYIDRYEVTVSDYINCVNAGRCDLPKAYKNCNWGVSGREKHPINCISWKKSKTYCEYSGKRLPTEAEWEKAATWNNGKKYKYSNGKNTISCKDAVMLESGNLYKNGGCGKKSTWDVGSKPQEINGTYDMTGNVYEWVLDFFERSLRETSHNSDPQGIAVSLRRERRGGSWTYGEYFLRGAYRSGQDPRHGNVELGFRCAVSP